MCSRITTSQTWTLSNRFHFALWVCRSLQFLQTWEIHSVVCGSGRTHLCLERKIESRMAVMKIMFFLAEPLKRPQRGCSGMCLAKGVKGRAYNWAQLPVVKVKIAWKSCWSSSHVKQDSRCAKAREHLILVLKLIITLFLPYLEPPFLITSWKKVLWKEEEILQTSGFLLFSFFNLLFA